MQNWFNYDFFLTDPGNHWLWLGLAVVILLLILFAVVALAVSLRLRNNHRSSQWRQVEGEWQPQLLDYLAGDLSAESIHKRLPRSHQVIFIQLLARFASQVQGHERLMLEHLAQPLMNELAKEIRSKHTGKRARAVRLIGILGLPKYKDAMVLSLKDSQLPVRMAAAQALIHNERCQDVDAVLENLHLFEEVTDNYMSSLLASAGHESQPYMRIFMAMPDPPASLRAIAARALLLMKDFEAAGIAAEIITPDIPPQLLVSCLGILAEMGEATHAPAIRKLFPIENTTVLAGICRALGQVGHKQDFPIFHHCMNHPSPWVNLAAARALGDLGGISELQSYAKSESPQAEFALEILSALHVDNNEEAALIGGNPVGGMIG